MIRKLGDESFGIWVLVFSLVEYCWVLDLGLVSATVKYSAHYRALDQPERVSQIVSTATGYYTALGLAIIAISLAVAPIVPRWFRISPDLHFEFSVLVAVAGVSWGAGAVANVFTACLNGFQRFDVTSKVRLLVSGARTAVILFLLAAGGGLTAIGLATLACQMAGYLYTYIGLRRAFPELRLGRRLIRREVWRELAGYGVHSFRATLASQILDQSAPVIIGHFQPAAAVGYFALPQRLLLYTVEAANRASQVAKSKAAEWSAHQRTGELGGLSAYVNRYCLAMMMPLSILLLVYGYELMRLWVGAAFAAQSAPLVPLFVCSTTLALAAQANSSSMLYAMARHGAYSRFLLGEAVLLSAGLWVIVPRYGHYGAAWIWAVLMIANRALLTPLLLTRELRISWWRYMLSVYVRPLAVAAPVAAAAVALKATLLAGRDLFELGAAAAFIGVVYYGLTYRFSIDPEHRAAILAAIFRRKARSATIN
jgi:O-antigen/teichoic acid export membrane protein